jgi:hypothetical protein
MTSTRQNNAQGAESVQDKAELVSMTSVGITLDGITQPKRIWLFESGGQEGILWCDDPDPSGDTPEAVEYVRADVYAAVAAALEHILRGALSLPRFAEDEARAALRKASGCAA